jgi:hypothetical protein
MNKSILYLVFYGILCVCQCFGGDSPEMGIPVPLVALIANPEKYDGKFIATEGYFIWRFEDTALYLSQEQANCLSLNRVDILLTEEKKSIYEHKNNAKISKYNRHWVLVRGVVKFFPECRLIFTDIKAVIPCK